MEKLRDYQTFDSVKSMDEFVSEALKTLKFTELERDLLWLLAGHSLKVAGVSWLKVQSMADQLGVSYKTAQRTLKSLKELGVIKRVRTIRPVSGGFGSSLTLICPIDLTQRKDTEKPSSASSQGASRKSKAFTFKAFSKDLKELRQQAVIDFTYLEEWLPSAFIHTVKPFVSPEEAFSLWGKVQVSAKRNAPDVVEIEEPAIRAFKAAVLAYKSRRIKGSFGAYFWGTLEGVFSVEQRRIKNKLWNWLEDDAGEFA